MPMVYHHTAYNLENFIKTNDLDTIREINIRLNIYNAQML